MTNSAKAVLAILQQHGPLTIKGLQHLTGLDWRNLYGATVELEDVQQLCCLARHRPWRYVASIPN